MVANQAMLIINPLGHNPAL